VGGFDESFMRGGEDVDFSFRMDARGMTAVFAERAIVHYRYRQDPRQTVRQLWGYGRSTAPVYRLHGIDPPSLLDVVITCHRLVKQAVRDALSGRRPVRQVVDMAYVIGEASTLWRDPAFWRPVARRGLVANPLVVQGQRARRLGRFLIGGFRARRG
jgi:GT2 family glycosyltransferase